MLKLDLVDYDKTKIKLDLDGEPLEIEVISLASLEGSTAFSRFLKYIGKLEKDGKKLTEDVVVLGEVVDTEPSQEYKQANGWLASQLASGWPKGFDFATELVENQALANVIFNAADKLAKEFAEKKKA